MSRLFSKIQIVLGYVLLARSWAVVVAQAVAHQTTDREVSGLNPIGSWAFFPLQSVVCPKSGSSWRWTILVFQLSN